MSVRLFLSRFLIFQVFITLSCQLGAQHILSNTIRGTVVDKQSLSPLPGATIVVLNSTLQAGATTDKEGVFLLSKIPIGKYQLKISYVGYAPVVTDPVIVSTGKEAVIQVSMVEMPVTANEVEIKSGYRKYEAINKMATVSVRSFSTDETFRFAGSYNDPARMAANFAGVTSGVDNRNDIIVRGNSPMGLQWRIDEMEIPNPNHFAAVGTTGGPVTILNNNLLTNSDFLTGAFPAQYGNTLAGIFDMRMRNGNNQKHEYWFQVGWNGLEFGTEGPFSKQHTASYLLSFRYSPLQFLNLFGINTGIVPKYEDVNLKITIPTRKAGTFTITGIGGTSSIELYDSRKDPGAWTFPDYGEDLANGSTIGVLGVRHQVFITPTLRLKNMLYVVGSGVVTKIDTFSNTVRTPSPWAGEHSTEVKYTLSSEVMKKFSAGNLLNAGFTWDYFRMTFADSIMFKGNFRVNTGSREAMHFFRGFIQWQHHFNDKFATTAGIFSSLLTLNGSRALEPRLGFDWIISERQTLNFGAGLYSEMQPRVIYFILAHPPGSLTTQPNRNLDYTRNAQIALGWNYLLTSCLHFKTEIYYQFLYDIPVKSSIPQYALSNEGHSFFVDRQYADSLVNKGTGQNYGIEFTFERFIRNNYFFLFTASVFNSTYSACDEVPRNSAFDVNYALNAVGGYEFIMGKRKWGVMSFGLRATLAGGSPYIPFNVKMTVDAGEPVYDWTLAYQSRYPAYKRISLRFGIKRNLPGYNIEFMLDLQYRTNYTNTSLQRIDPKTGEIKNYFGMGFFPMGTWRIQF